EFYTVKDCISKYYTYCAIVSNPAEYYGDTQQDVLTQAKNENAQIIYNMLDTEYKEVEGITELNIVDKVEKSTNSIVDIENMQVSAGKNGISAYIANGTLRDKKTKEVKAFQVIVRIDATNDTFSILPKEYVSKKYPNIEDKNTLEELLQTPIKTNANNKYIFRTVAEDVYAIDLFDNFKERLEYHQETMYDNLDEEYKTTKFAALTEFKVYIQNRYKKIETLKAESFSKSKKENYTQYIYIDANGDYYIFKETAPMKYTAILDTYTIDIPEFTKKYETSKAQEKVILNINKFMQSINDKDYKYAYNILAESFKQSNFKSQAEFESYIKTNWFENNKFDYEKFGDESNTYYTYQVKVTDKTGMNNKQMTKTFIVLLEEGTDFKLSFNK
ncbi:MAG: hypothetical protein HFJ51_00270, partial [Clostridia bacterium]|nr:hypothetical protein [Clostridia bacterium]